MTDLQHEQRHQMMTTEPVNRLITKLAIPTILAMLVTSIYNMADTYFVSQLGTSASGAVGIVFPIMTMIQAIGFMLGNGGGNTLSRYLGAKKNHEAEQVASTAFFTSIFLGLILMIIGQLFLNKLMVLIGATDTILPYAHQYGFYILLGAPYMAASFTLNNLLRSQGNSISSMIGIMVGGIINIILDPIFIYTFGFETAGAAIATIISQFISFLILLYFINSKNSIVKIKFKNFTLQWKIFREIFSVGLPSFYRQGLASIAMILLNAQAGIYGDAAISAMTIVTRIYQFIFSSCLGLGQGFQPVCGYNYGAKRYDRVKQGFWFFVKVVIVVFSIISLLAIFNASSIMAIFRRNDPEVIAIGTKALIFYCLSIPLLSWTVACNITSQAIGKSIYASIISLSQQGLFFIPAILLLPRYIGITAIQVSIPLANLLTFLISIPIGIKLLQELNTSSKKETNI